MGLQIRQKLSSLGPILAIDAPSPTGFYGELKGPGVTGVGAAGEALATASAALAGGVGGAGGGGTP